MDWLLRRRGGRLMQSPITRVPLSAVAPLSPRGAGLSHRGLVRERNEDAILIDPEGVLWAVADGMGGYGNGDVASDIVTEYLADLTLDDAPANAVIAQLCRANAAVVARAAAAGAGIMGATVVVMVIERATAHIIWAGDSRAYLLRDGRLRLLTRDHTVVQSLIETGVLDSRAAAHHPEAHVVTRAVGGDIELESEHTTVLLTPGDRVLLCSDGLTACVADQEICDHLSSGQTPDDTCRALIGHALENGAPDNVSVISVFFAET